MANEARHLQFFETIIPKGKHTRLLLVWRMAGWTLGFVPTILGGKKALYVTVEAVETFVEEHFQEQIVPLQQQIESGRSAPRELIRLLEHCCEDEVHHKEDAARRLLDGDQEYLLQWWISPWVQIVKQGSALAADIARRV